MDVRVASQALGVGPGKGTLEVPVVYDGKSSLVPGWAAGNEGTPVVRLAVDIASLDQVVADAGFDRLDWLLIDVEGAEVSVLRGARQTLRATRRVIIEVARSPMLRECRQILVEEFGFRIVATEEQNEFTEYWYAVRPQVAPAS
jgi:hypothetical protein